VNQDGSAEGWYVDPYGEHDARWFSEGTPTSLVRDDSIESRDEPPERPFVGPLERPEPSHTATASDMRRADDSSQPDYGQTGMSAITKYMPPGPT
jgi:hypothetical protein